MDGKQFVFETSDVI